jgi:hypothetical protein
MKNVIQTLVDEPDTKKVEAIIVDVFRLLPKEIFENDKEEEPSAVQNIYCFLFNC